MIKKHPLLFVCAAFLAAVSLLDPLFSSRGFSDLENRVLAQRPQLTWERVTSGKFMADYETYVNDQFILRDWWITLKSLSESAMLKIENNSVAYGAGGYLFERYPPLDENRVNTNVTALNGFMGKYENAYLALIPPAEAVLTDKLPLGFPTADFSSLYNSLAVLPVLDELRSHRDEDIYYRTDHHYTTLGAYYAYLAYCRGAGLSPVDEKTLEVVDVRDFYGTLYSKAKKIGLKPDIIRYYPMSGIQVELNGKTYDSMYDASQFSKRDKYAGFLYGNNGLTVITRLDGDAQRGTLALIKDSFGNSIAPFLTHNYNRIIMIDLRYYNAPVRELLSDENPDDILLLYSSANLAADVNIPKLSR